MLMKKFFTLLVTILFFVSCTTDDSVLDTSENNYSPKSYRAGFSEKYMKSEATCFSSLEGSLRMDITDGLNNPTIKFRGEVPNYLSSQGSYSLKLYTFKLYIQPIADCEDMNSDDGDALVYTYPVFISNVNEIPSIDLKPNQIPFQCYKWRVEISREINRVIYCSTSSTWYDAPVL